MTVRDERWYLETVHGRAIIRWSMFEENVRRVWPERLLWRVVHRMPRRLAYMAACRVGGDAIRDGEYPDDVTVPMMLERWGKGTQR